MRVEIYEPGVEIYEPEEEQDEEPLRLALGQDDVGVNVVAVDESGEPEWYVAAVTDEGRLRVFNDCMVEGLQLDGGARRIVVETEDGRVYAPAAETGETGETGEAEPPSIMVADSRLYLGLVQREDRVIVQVVDSRGRALQGGTLAAISAAGLQFIGSVSPDLGFPLDHDGELLLQRY